MELDTSPRSNAVYHAEIAVRPAPGDVPHTTTRTDKPRCLPHTNRIHVLICILTIVVVICVAVVLSVVLKKKDDGPPLVRPADIDVSALPVTPLSSDTRATMLSMMDKSVDPCNDMFRYACGGFIKNTKVEEQFSDPYNYKFNTIDNRTRTQIQTILEQDTNVVGRFYSSCLNTTDIETYNKSAILPYLEFITRSVVDLNSYYHVLGQLKRTGLMDKVHVQVDFTTTPDTQIWVLVLNPTATNKFPDSNYIYPLLGLIGMDRISIMQAYNLASSMYNTYTRNPSQPLKLVSRSDLRSVIPGMDSFIEGLGDASFTTTGSVPSTTSNIDRVVIPRFSTLQAFHSTLQITSVDTLRNYLIMQFMVAAVPYLPTYFQNAYNYVPGKTMNEFNPFSTFTFGMRDAEEESGALYLSDDSRYDDTIRAFLNQRPSRASICATATVSLFPDDIGKQWIDRFFPTEHKALVARLSSMMQAGVSLRMYNNPWLDKTTKRAALEKSSQMIQNLIINTNLQLVPSWLPLTGHFLWDLSVASSWYADQALTKLVGSNLKRTSMPPGVAATMANAFYYPAANSVNLVGGLILTPFFDSNYPFWLNVASYGSVIGHEFTHGFDDTGRLFDSTGRVIPWWTDDATSAFQSRAQCLISDYNRYTVITPKGIKSIDGKLTLGENIADIGGYAVAWDVYRAMPPQPRLFDDMTNDQAFWIAAAQTWCGVVSPEASEQLLSGDVHSPGEARVNVAMSHRPEVATAFNCPSYTRMGKSLTSQRCEVW